MNLLKKGGDKMDNCPNCQAGLEKGICSQCGFVLSKRGPSVESATQGYHVNVTEYLSKGWEIFKKNIGEFIGYFVTIMIINVVLSLIPILGTLASVIISTPLYAGFLIVAFKLMKNQKVEFGDFFGGFRYFLPLFLAGLLTSIFIGIGIIFLIIPGIYLAVSYLFSTPLILDKKMDFWEAMETSRKTITKNWFGFFGFSVIMLLINFGGGLLLGVGLLVTVPVTACAIAVAYDDIFGIKSRTT